MRGIIGEGVDLNLVHTGDLRTPSLALYLTKRLLETKWRDPNEDLKMHLFGKLRNVVRQWLDTCLVCRGGTYPAQLMYQSLADMACNKITAAITGKQGERSIKALLDSYNPTGSTRHVNFTTSKTGIWATDPRKCHVNLAVLDSDWEAEFCRVVESHPNVKAYVKNHNLGLEVPYLYGSTPRRYIPDFIVQVDGGQDDPLNLIVEIKGYRGEDVREKNNAMESYWLPGVNALGQYGRWAFAEFTDVYDIQAELERAILDFVDSPNSGPPEGYSKYDYSNLGFKETLVAGPSFDDLDLTRFPDDGRDVSFLHDDAGGSEPQIENIARRQSEEYADHLVEQHRTQGEGMMKFLEFQRGLPENQRGLSQRERYLLFLEHESHLSEEGREHYLRILEHERQYIEQRNPGPLASDDPASPPEANDPD